MAVGKLRRSDRAMSEEDTVVLLRRALVGRIGTVDADGMPYVVPLNFVYEHATCRIHLHFSKQPGHLASNLKFSSKVCFEVDEPGPLIATGETGCAFSFTALIASSDGVIGPPSGCPGFWIRIRGMTTA